MRSISQEIRNVVVFFLTAALLFNLESNPIGFSMGRGGSKMSVPHSFVCFCGTLMLLSNVQFNPERGRPRWGMGARGRINATGWINVLIKQSSHSPSCAPVSSPYQHSPFHLNYQMSRRNRRFGRF